MIIADVENAIITQLQAYSGSGEGKLGYTLDIASYGGELDDTDALAAARLKYPAVRILFREASRPRDLGAGQMVDLNYTIFAASKNLRNERARRQGALGEIGTYQILWDCRRLLAGQQFGLDIQPLKPGSMLSTFQGRVNNHAISVYALTVTAGWYEDLTPLSDEALGEFLLLHNDWDIPPLGNVLPPLPADEADAQDEFNPRSEEP